MVVTEILDTVDHLRLKIVYGGWISLCIHLGRGGGRARSGGPIVKG